MSFATRLWPDGIASASGPTVSRRRSTEWVGSRPASLSQVLQVFRALLGTGETADLGGADALVGRICGRCRDCALRSRLSRSCVKPPSR